MKESQVKKLVAGMDFTKDDSIVDLTSAINDEYNHNLKKVESEHEKTVSELRDEIVNLKGQVKAAKDLESQLKSEKAKNESMSRMNYIIKNVNSELSEEDMQDLVLFTNAKMTPESKFEDVVKQVAEKRGFAKAKPAPKAEEPKQEPAKPAEGVAFRTSATYDNQGNDWRAQKPTGRGFDVNKAKEFADWRKKKY